MHPRHSLMRLSRQPRSSPSPKRWGISHDSKRQVLCEEILALSRPRPEDLRRLAENVPLFYFVTYPSSHITDSPQRYNMKALDSSPDLKNVNEFGGHYLSLSGAKGTHLHYINYSDWKFKKVSNDAFMRNLTSSRCRQMALICPVPWKVSNVLATFDPQTAPYKVSTPYPPCLPSSPNTSPVTLGKLMSVLCRARRCHRRHPARWTVINTSIQFLLREETLNKRVATYFLLFAFFIRETLCRAMPSISTVITKGHQPFSCIQKQL